MRQLRQVGKDRAILIAGLVTLTILCWTYLVYDAWQMHLCGTCMGMALPQDGTWSSWDLAAIFGMWSIMMIGMMVPSAAPVVMLVGALNAQRRAHRRALFPASIFLAGYLVVWIAFSLAITTFQWLLHTFALLSSAMRSTNPAFGAAVLVAAGAFQLSPLKNVCLIHCRSPLNFLMSEWREGGMGALSMGVRHGSYCVGCCWLVMCILFVTGVMNLRWVIVITLFVLVEKLAPRSLRFSRAAGVLLIAWGLWVALAAYF